MGLEEDGSDRSAPPGWLRAPWEAARRRSLPLCLMLFARDHADGDGAVLEQVAAVLPADGFGPFAVDHGHCAAALMATSPEAAYQAAYRIYRGLGEGWRMGLAMAAPRSDGHAQALLRHARHALENADPRHCPVQGMDVILS